MQSYGSCITDDNVTYLFEVRVGVTSPHSSGRSNEGMYLGTVHVLSAAILSFHLFIKCITLEHTKDLSNEATSCPGQPNTNVPWTGTPTLVKEVANGSLYTVGEADDQMYGKNCSSVLFFFKVNRTPNRNCVANGSVLQILSISVYRPTCTTDAC